MTITIPGTSSVATDSLHLTENMNTLDANRDRLPSDHISALEAIARKAKPEQMHGFIELLAEDTTGLRAAAHSGVVSD